MNAKISTSDITSSDITSSDKNLQSTYKNYQINSTFKINSREKIENNDRILENKYENLLFLLDKNKEKSTFIVNLWKSYLQNKKEAFEKSLDQCKTVVEKLEKISCENETEQTRDFNDLNNSSVTSSEMEYINNYKNITIETYIILKLLYDL